MIVFTGIVKKEYSFTAEGSFVEWYMKNGRPIAFQATRNPDKFLKWMLRDMFADQAEAKHRAILITFMKAWWEMRGGTIINGHFNMELYLKVIEAKKKSHVQI